MTKQVYIEAKLNHIETELAKAKAGQLAKEFSGVNESYTKRFKLAIIDLVGADLEDLEIALSLVKKRLQVLRVKAKDIANVVFKGVDPYEYKDDLNNLIPRIHKLTQVKAWIDKEDDEYCVERWIAELRPTK